MGWRGSGIGARTAAFWIAALLVVLVVLLVLATKQNLRRRQRMKLVVSRYAENVDWLFQEPFRRFPAVIYEKGPTVAPRVRPGDVQIRLPNVGKCDHTFLHHLVETYDQDDQDDVLTVFLPGSAMDDRKRGRVYKVMELAEKGGDSVLVGSCVRDVVEAVGNFSLDHYTTANESNRRANPEKDIFKSPLRPYPRWHRHHFGEARPASQRVSVDSSPSSIVSLMSIFAVSKKHVRARPCSFYRSLRDEVGTHSNPEAGHFIERSWGSIFSSLDPTRHLYDEEALSKSANVVPGSSSAEEKPTTCGFQTTAASQQAGEHIRRQQEGRA